MEVSLAGDKISYFNRTYYKVPEDFKRKLVNSNIYKTLFGFLIAIIFLGFVILFMIQLFRMFRNREFLWKRAVFITFCLLALSILETINGIPGIILSYAEEPLTPLGVFITQWIIGYISSLVFGFLGIWFTTTFGMACYRRLVSKQLTIPKAISLLHPQHWGHPACLQGLMMLISTLLLPIPFFMLSNRIENRWFMADKTELAHHPSFSYSGLDSYVPFIAHILSTVHLLIWLPITISILFAFYFYWIKRWNKLFLLFTVGLTIAGIWINTTVSWQYRLYDTITFLITTGMVLLILFKVIRNNWWFYLIGFWLFYFIGSSMDYFDAYHWTWKLEGYFYLVIGIIPLLVIPYQYWRNRGKYKLE
jgi:hypothetical protein